jgi:hypothetical protein
VEALASDGVKLQSRAARFAGTLGNSSVKKTRLEPLLIGKNNNTVYYFNQCMLLKLILGYQMECLVTNIDATFRSPIFPVKSKLF